MKKEVRLQEGTSALYYFPDAFPELNTAEFIESISWTQNDILMFGKTFQEPRLTAWFGKTYNYSNIHWPMRTFPVELDKLKSRIEEIARAPFNGCLLNLYRNGNDSMGWHRDNEKEIDQTCIASLSLGAPRDFKVRNRNTKEVITVQLTHGSLLIMKNLQEHYEHSVPKRKRVHEPRINMTFRQLY